MKSFVCAALAALVLIKLGHIGVRGEEVRVINALVIVDNSLYTLKWKDSTNDEIECYFNTIINGTAKRLESIGNPAITVSMFDMYVIKDTSEADFVKYFNYFYGSTAPSINPKITRKEFYNWLNQPGNEYSSYDYDAVILYTSSQVGTIKVSAPLGSLCGDQPPVILVTDEGLFNSIDATAHGLGLSLGSERDGDHNKCDINDHYIMTTRRNQMEGEVYKNHLTFSKCSIDYIRSFLKKKGPKCLAKGYLGQCIDEENCGLQDAGQRYPLDKQCQFAIGAGSELCIGNFKVDREMCTEVYCRSVEKTKSGNICDIVIPVDGTTCGVNKWCQDGKCVINPNGSDSATTCEDKVGKVLTVDGVKRSCKEIKKNYPYICEHEYYSSYCCKTCQKATS